MDTLLQALEGFIESPEPLPAEVVSVLGASCLIATLESYLRNDSLLDMIRFLSLHLRVLRLVQCLTQHPDLLPLVVNSSIKELMQQLDSMAQVVLRTVKQSRSKLQPDKKEELTEEVLLAEKINQTAEFVLNAIEVFKAERQNATSTSKFDETTSFEENYKASLKPLQFSEVSMKKQGQYVQ